MSAEQLLPQTSDEARFNLPSSQEPSVANLLVEGVKVAAGGIYELKRRKPNRRPVRADNNSPVEPILRPPIDLGYLSKGRRKYRH